MNTSTRPDQVRTYNRHEAIVFRKTNAEFGGLSNMAPGFPLHVNGTRILTSEALYQACRFPHRPDIQRLIIEQASPMTAKMKSKPYRADSRPDWDKVRVNVMRWCLRVKLAQNWHSFRELLLATGDRPIVEESPKDDFWGAKPRGSDDLTGLNVLGRLLMELRTAVRERGEELRQIPTPNVPHLDLLGKPVEGIESAEAVGAAVQAHLSMTESSRGAGAGKVAVARADTTDPPGAPRPATGTHTAPDDSYSIPRECKRLAEVDFPIAIVSKHAVSEKEARAGHIPKIHIWPAARPIASSRAMLLALLLPDPADPYCPSLFKARAREVLGTVQNVAPSDADLQRGLLKFIGDFASWDLASNARYLEASRALVRAAYPDEPPLVVDPFAGGGSIPLEALRLGCDAFASDLNPVACLILKVVLEDIPHHGTDLAAELNRIASEIKGSLEDELAEFYPHDADGSRPITYLWARTVRCETPGCGAEIPLMRSCWLSKKATFRRALRYRAVTSRHDVPEIQMEIFEPASERDVQRGTVSAAKATCPACNIVLGPERVRAQLSDQRGGADVIFGPDGRRLGGARLLAVVSVRTGESGRLYRSPTPADYEAVLAATNALRAKIATSQGSGMSLVPDEEISTNELRRVSVPLYGMRRWSDLFTCRQSLALSTLAQLIATKYTDSKAGRFLALNFSKMIDMNNALATWQPHAGIPAHMFTRNAIPMKWDFAEAVPVSDSSGTLQSAVKRSTEPMNTLAVVERAAAVHLLDAASSTLPDEAAAVWFSDPPYYDAVPYSHLSDFFYVWLRRALPNQLPELFSSPQVVKDREIVVDRRHSASKSTKDVAFYETGMASAFAEGRRVLGESGIGSIVFAHKTTEGWEALLSGMIRGGWTITASWPVATEMGSRLNARDTASLATSVHLVCRPRLDDSSVGDWAHVLRELPSKVGDWIKRLQGEGIRGADLVFACIGPALEIFSRYARVETAEGAEVPLADYLEKVWEVVGRAALTQVLGGESDTGALEEDARLVALFLWTLQSTAGLNGAKDDAGEEVEDDEGAADADDEDGAGSGRKAKGYALVYDVVRRFAQPLGIHLEDWERRVIETKKGTVRLLPVTERAKQLFGEDGAHAAADQLETPGASPQLSLFPEVQAVVKPKRGKKVVVTAGDDVLAERRGATTLDRLHAAMLLQASGRSNALRSLLAAEVDRGPEFLRLANSLSALYPRDSEEKRLIDAMLLAAPR